MAIQIARRSRRRTSTGIVHRDLKPANIRIKPDGDVKVLDFGFAKMADGFGFSGASPDRVTDLYRTPRHEAGVILGTAAYMAPEQARLQPVDKRADIWAFGVVLWEMLTGRKLFSRETASDSLAAVLKEEPSWDDVSPRMRPLLRRCLEKDPRKRLHDIADARLWLEEVTPGSRRADGRLVAIEDCLAGAGGRTGLSGRRGRIRGLEWLAHSPGRALGPVLDRASAGHDVRWIALGNSRFARRSVDRLLGEHHHHRRRTLSSFSGFRINPAPRGYGTR